MTAKPEAVCLPIPQTHRETLEAFGIPGILELIANGHSQDAIAKMLMVDSSALGNFLAQCPERHLVAEALRRSAEAWLDKGDAIIEGADYETVTGPQVALLKLKAEAAYRRAGIRNARYRDKAPAEDPSDVPAPQAPPSFVLVVHGSATVEGRQVATYENDPDGGSDS